VTRRLVIGLLAVLVAACGGMMPSGSAPSARPALVPSPAPTRPATPVPVPKHEVYGYVPYWEMDDSIASHVGGTDLTTLALFSVTHRRDGGLDDQNGLRRIRDDVGRDLVRAARRNGSRVEIVYTSFGEGKNRRFYADAAAQERWIGEIVDLVEELDLDGINVDVEALPLDLVAAYGGFVGRLRTALRDRRPDAQVSVATQANEVGAAMAAAAGSAGADRIFLMGYDYRTARSAPGASAPIDRIDGETRDLVWSLDLYAMLGVPSERLLLGLPLYGNTWPVIGPGYLAPSSGPGDPWVPRRNLEVVADPGFAPTYEPIESVEFYTAPTAFSSPDAGASSASASSPEPVAWDAVYYDSPRSLTPKLRLANERGLAGAGFWAIGYERGLPDYTELISTFRAGELPPD
jgi:spore germination protein YaaH